MLLAALRAAGNGAASGPVVSTDLFYGATCAEDGAIALDLTTAAVFAVAARHGVRAAAVLAVGRGRRRADRARGLEAAEVELGRVAAAALV